MPQLRPGRYDPRTRGSGHSYDHDPLPAQCASAVGEPWVRAGFAHGRPTFMRELGLRPVTVREASAALTRIPAGVRTTCRVRPQVGRYDHHSDRALSTRSGLPPSTLKHSGAACG